MTLLLKCRVWSYSNSATLFPPRTVPHTIHLHNRDCTPQTQKVLDLISTSLHTTIKPRFRRKVEKRGTGFQYQQNLSILPVIQLPGAFSRRFGHRGSPWVRDSLCFLLLFQLRHLRQCRVSTCCNCRLFHITPSPSPNYLYHLGPDLLLLLLFQ